MSTQPAKQLLRVLGIGTASPDHELDAESSKQLLHDMFNPPERVMSVIEQQQVQMRRILREPSWYTSGATYPERNAVAVTAAQEMTENASKAAFAQSLVKPADIAAIVMVTSTVVSMPGLENHLIMALGLRPSVLRVPVWGRGCTGGVVGTNLGARLSASFEGQPVLVVVVDCCTANVQAGDRSLTNILISALYADGAAAVLVGNGSAGPEILGSRSAVVPGTAELGGWDVLPTGLRYRHHASITAIATEWIPGEVLALREAHGYLGANPGTVILQPVNRDALLGQSDAMNLSEEVRELNGNNLSTRGNLSGPAVLFALHDLLTLPGHPATPTAGEPFTLVGTGPGYSIEQILLRC
jgi:alkylresorcinol/alkylpyrone synthase